MSVLSSFEELEKEIENIKDEFYSESGGKNVVFKKSQKYDCAKKIVSKIPLDTLLNRMCIIFENSNSVHIDYPIMKTFASPENFESISEYIISNFDYLKHTYPVFEVFLNFDGFTVSAAERYKLLIEIFCKKCFQKNAGFAFIVTQFVVYNAPTMIDSIKHIFWPFLEEHMKKKLVVVQKKDSTEIIDKIMRLHKTI